MIKHIVSWLFSKVVSEKGDIMSEKRRDRKNRVLRNGESQRKDGRYMYKYNDANGEVKYFYSWRLDKNDPTPVGKKYELSLREKVRKMEEDRFAGILPGAEKTTVLELVEKYVSLKTGVRHNTEVNYRFVINIIKKEPFGKMRIDRVKQSDAKAWFIKLQKDGRGYSTIHTMRGVVRPAFQMATDDDLIRKNPFDFQLATVVVNDSVTREAISRADMRKFLKFVEEDKHFSKYYEGFFILFHTGLRISEFVGLTINDIDFTEMKIHVTHQLQRKNKNGMPMVALHWEKYFQHVVEKYNGIYKIQMPKITPHVCRHTFCSNMAKSGMNPKTLQYIMGHSDIGVTLNTYTHLTFDDAKEEMERLSKAQ